MEKQVWKPLMVLSIFLLSSREIRVFANPQVPCYFIFGDSISDNGNNNNLNTLAKANYRPYGIDFPNSVPTGRFTNGFNLVDFIARFLGFPNFIPSNAAVSTATGQDILKGVNYASGAAGIRDETGRLLGQIISMDEQIRNHERKIIRINNLLRSKNVAEALLKKCIYTVAIGSNDYLNNYFLPPFYTASLRFTPEQYAIALIKQLAFQLKTLYRDGARKIAVFGVGLIGCTPYARAKYDTNGSFCVERINNAINLFNVKLRSLVIDLNTDLSDAKFTFINATSSSSTGLLIVDTPCCKLDAGGIQCQPSSTPCPNRDQYLFWDGVHPTNIAYYGAALAAYQPTSPDAAFPFSISQLALL